ncbi:hypothetical protein SBA4_20012 [Candidatus Sulfopaludibacter sp. SbA4]|nr:hypothetical protein SBA4_20012 [Candidatus Sulfopaludibacter sp. SbA4]
MEADIAIWRENPVFGVGPGVAADLRGHYGEHVAAHTEFSRMLSEHGLLGIAAIVVLMGIAVRTFLRAHGAGGKALALSLMAWSLLYMGVNAMRLAVPSFTFGLACATVLAEKRVVRRARRIVQLDNGVMGADVVDLEEDPRPALPTV